jgi:rubrerythrin
MTETKTLMIVEFLEARIAEDEAIARATYPYPENAEYFAAEALRDAQPHGSRCGWRMGEQLSDGCECDYPARVLREVEAKRAILADHETRVERGFDPVDAIDWSCSVCSRCGTISSDESDGCPTVRALASVYADHPDYRGEWR